MKLGKLTPDELQSIVFPQRGTRRPEVLVRSGVGLDCALVNLAPDTVVLSTDPITGAGANAGWLAIHVGCNDVATTGAQPVGVLLTLLLAQTNPIEDARAIMADAHRAAMALGVEVIGGHSEISPGLSTSIVVVTAIGRVSPGGHVTPAGARPGDAVLLSKAAGLEGTAILAADRASYLRGRVSDEVVARGGQFQQEISIVPEALAAARAGATAMHDATEGGILGALAELAVASGFGVDVDAGRIPVRPETTEICAAFGIDPLDLISSGALLVATSRPDEVIAAIRETGCAATPIGRIVAGPSRIRRAGRVYPLVAPERDALWDALAQS